MCIESIQCDQFLEYKQHYSLTCSIIEQAMPAYRFQKYLKYQFVFEKKKNYSHDGE
jgi:hypothetical protein